MSQASTSTAAADTPVSPGKWVCQRCGYDTSCKSNLVRHLRRLSVCNSTNSNISVEDYLKELLKKEYNEKTYDCQFCNARFNARSNKSRHLKTCSAKAAAETPTTTQPVSSSAAAKTPTLTESTPSNAPDVLKYISDLQNENQLLRQRIEKMERMAAGASSSNTVINNNTLNNNGIIINLNSFGHEDTSYLSHDFLSYCLLNPRKGLTSLIENIHYNKEYPHNQNLRCKSLKQNVFEKYEDSSWRACDASNTLDELIKKGYKILNTHYAENYMNDPSFLEDENKQKVYERFRFLGDTSCNDYFAVKRELRILVKDRTMYLIASPDE